MHAARVAMLTARWHGPGVVGEMTIMGATVREASEAVSQPVARNLVLKWTCAEPGSNRQR